MKVRCEEEMGGMDGMVRSRPVRSYDCRTLL
jgi:hypothetical protein